MNKCFRWKIHPHCICIQKIADICFCFFFVFQSWGRKKTMFSLKIVKGFILHDGTFHQGLLIPAQGTRCVWLQSKVQRAQTAKELQVCKLIQILGSGWANLQIMRCLLLSQFKAAGASTRGRVWNLVGSKSDGWDALPILYLGELGRRGFLWQRFHVSHPLSRHCWMLMSKSGELSKVGFPYVSCHCFWSLQIVVNLL